MTFRRSVQVPQGTVTGPEERHLCHVPGNADFGAIWLASRHILM